MSNDDGGILGIISTIANIIIGGLMGIVLLAVGIGIMGFSGYSVFVVGGSTSSLIFGAFGVPFAGAGFYMLYKTARGEVEGGKAGYSKHDRHMDESMDDAMDAMDDP